MRKVHIVMVGLMAAGLTVAFSRPVGAESPEVKVIQRYGLNSTSCLAFVDATSVDYRKERWHAAIEALWRVDRDRVLGWIIGRVDPPVAVVQEARRQRDCLLEGVVREAAEPASDLVVDWQKERGTKAQMPGLLKRIEDSPSFRDRFVATLTESDYRGAREQSWIWKRKFVLSGRNFNAVSAVAAELCGIPEGHAWRPDDSRHQSCWHALGFEGREREILQASSAPGISRHHWGTDFDLFSLAPASFRGNGRHADEYRWMAEKALAYGFFQPYATPVHEPGVRYMEERWHWSYYPVAQALTEFAASHEDAVEAALMAQWDGFEARWNVGRAEPRPFFGLVRRSWRNFFFDVDTALVTRRAESPSSFGTRRPHPSSTRGGASP